MEKVEAVTYITRQRSKGKYETAHATSPFVHGHSTNKQAHRVPRENRGEHADDTSNVRQPAAVSWQRFKYSSRRNERRTISARQLRAYTADDQAMLTGVRFVSTAAPRLLHAVVTFAERCASRGGRTDTVPRKQIKWGQGQAVTSLLSPNQKPKRRDRQLKSTLGVFAKYDRKFPIKIDSSYQRVFLER